LSYAWEICGGGGQIVFLFLATIILRRALSIVHEIKGIEGAEGAV
jgi:hypothetical protein